MKEKKYCKKCGIALVDTIFKKEYYSFEDGDYCPKCAKIKVERARGEK